MPKSLASSPHRRPIVTGMAVVLASVLALVLVLNLRSDPPAGVLLRAAPGLERRLAEHLVADTPDALAAYCADLDAQQLIDASSALSDGLDCTSADAFDRSLATVLPPLERLGQVLATRGHTRGPLTLARYLRTAPADEAYRISRLKSTVSELCDDPELTLDHRYATALALADSVAPCPPCATYVESRLLELAADGGHHEQKRAHLRRAIGLARRSGQFPLLSQLLGTFCDDRLTAGHRDSAAALADEALDVALGAGLPLQAARIHYIFGADHGNRGEISLASERFDEAVAVARRFNAGHVELRFLLAQLRFQASLGCWDLVGRSLPRLELLADQVPDLKNNALRGMLEVAALRLKAGYQSHAGLPQAADSLYAAAGRLARDLPRNYIYAFVVAEWSDWLVDGGQTEQGLALAQQGLEYTADEGLDRLTRRMHAIAARGLMDAGRADEAVAHVDSALAAGSRDESEAFADAVLGLRLAAARGDRAAVETRTDLALQHLVGSLLGWGTRAEMYLRLHQHDFFRELLHRNLVRIEADGPALELAWRGLREYARTTNPVDVSAATFLAHGRARLDALRSWSRDEDVHVLMFGEIDGVLRRWQLVAGHVSAVDMDRGLVAPRLDNLAALMAEAGPDRPWPGWPELIRQKLAQAGDDLLPPWVRTRGGRLLVATSPVLKDIPLEACDIGSGPDYQPLAATWQVAYLSRRGAVIQTTDTGAGACVVGVPEPSRSLRRQRPSLQNLPGAAAEARHAAAILPDATLITGPDATKPTIASAMEQARIFYLAGHAVDDPEMPYRTFIPCADTPGDSTPEQARLVFRHPGP